MLYGEHLHAQELPPQCQTCSARATYEVFDIEDRTHGFFCKRCGRRKLKALQHLENLFARKEGY